MGVRVVRVRVMGVIETLENIHPPVRVEVCVFRAWGLNKMHLHPLSSA